MQYQNLEKEELLRLLEAKDEQIKHMESTFSSSFSKDFKNKERSNFGHSIDWLEHSPVCTKIVDLDFNLQYMSRAGIEGLQIKDVSEYYGKPYPFSFFPQVFIDKMKRALNKVKDSKEISYVTDEPLSDIHGNLHCFNATLIPVFNQKNEIDYIIVVSINVSDMKKAEKEKMDMQRQVFHASKLISLGEIAANVGHEINNPLAIATGFLDKLNRTLPKELVNDEDINKSLFRIHASHERIISIVNQLRNFARMDDENQKIFLVHDSISQSMDLMQELYKTKGINLTYECSDKKITLLGNEGHFQQALMNLITNARDAVQSTQKKEIHLKLEKLDNNLAKLTVTDTGTGIPKELQEKVLEPFFTTKEIGKGTGMGLGIVLKTVNEMKGELTLESETAQGTKFEIKFPLNFEEPNIQTDIKNKETKTPSFSGKALIVDDEEYVRELVCEMLSTLGVETDEANDGLEALDKVKANSYDYIFTDLVMPNMRGEEFIKEAKPFIDSKTKILIISGLNQNKHLLENHNTYIQKPFTIEDIIGALSNL